MNCARRVLCIASFAGVAGSCNLESLSSTSQDIVDYESAKLNLTWSNASHNTYLTANTPGPLITSHFGTATSGGYSDTNHIEIDLRDTLLSGQPFPNPPYFSLSGNWYVAHGASGPPTAKCGEGGGTLVSCLDRIAEYHASNPGHPLITVWFDKKQGWESLTNASLRSPQRLNSLILQRFALADLFRPRDLGDKGADTLRAALANGGWPSHKDLTGRVAFFMTSDAGKDGNTRLKEMITTLGWDSAIFPAASAVEYDEVAQPLGFEGDDEKNWVVVMNFEWVDADGSGGVWGGDGECDSHECFYLAEAHDRGYLTRVYDIDDPAEADSASSRPFVEFGYGHANFVPVDYPWATNVVGGHANFPDGIYPW